MNKTPLSSLEHHTVAGKMAEETLADKAAGQFSSKSGLYAQREARAQALYALFQQQQEQY